MEVGVAEEGWGDGCSDDALEGEGGSGEDGCGGGLHGYGGLVFVWLGLRGEEWMDE